MKHEASDPTEDEEMDDIAVDYDDDDIDDMDDDDMDDDDDIDDLDYSDIDDEVDEEFGDDDDEEDIESDVEDDLELELDEDEPDDILTYEDVRHTFLGVIRGEMTLEECVALWEKNDAVLDDDDPDNQHYDELPSETKRRAADKFHRKLKHALGQDNGTD